METIPALKHDFFQKALHVQRRGALKTYSNCWQPVWIHKGIDFLYQSYMKATDKH